MSSSGFQLPELPGFICAGWEAQPAEPEPPKSRRLLLAEAESGKSVEAPKNARQGDLLGSDAHHPLIVWFNREVRSELQAIHRKLDALSSQSTIAEGHKRQARSRSITKRVDPQELVRELGKHIGNERSKTSGSLTDTPVRSGLELVLSSPMYKRYNSGSSQDTKGHSADRSNTNTPHLAPSITKSSLAGRSFNSGIEDDVEFDIVEDAVAVCPGPQAGSTPDTSGGGQPSPHARRESTTQDWEHVKYLLSRRSERSCRVKIWSFLEIPESSVLANIFARVTPFFILGTVLVTLLQVLDPAPLCGLAAAVIETVIDCLFTLEFLLRLGCCPELRAFFLSTFNFIDLAAAAPLVVRAASGFVLPEGDVDSAAHGFLLTVVPIIRLLKTLRRFEKFHLLEEAFFLAAEALPVLIFILTLITMVFTVLVFVVEPRGNIPTLQTSMWFTIVTMTTVGYGDVTPESSLGHFIAGILVVITVLYMAIPLGIIGNAFTETWDARDRILLMHRTRDRLRQWGYSAHDIPVLFQVSDQNRDGELDVTEFRQLLTRMQIGFSEERILNLFHSFDSDNSGTVDDREFVRALFPEKFHEIYYEDDEKGT